MVSRSCFTPVKDQKFVIQISTLLIVHKLREEKKEKQRLDASWNMFLFRVSDIRPYKLFSILFLEKAVQIELGKWWGLYPTNGEHGYNFQLRTKARLEAAVRGSYEELPKHEKYLHLTLVATQLYISEYLKEVGSIFPNIRSASAYFLGKTNSLSINQYLVYSNGCYHSNSILAFDLFVCPSVVT
jgi:hypothetical protein